MDDPALHLQALKDQDSARQNSALEAALDELLADPDFLHLQHREDRPNLFRILGRSYTEMWHSAFLRWLLDPASHHGLSDFPVKRFLATVLNHGIRQEGYEAFDSRMTLADIEQADLSHIRWETERPIGREEGRRGPARIDLYGATPDIDGSQSDFDDFTPIQIVMENKVRARERGEQTSTYFKWAEQAGFKTSVYVFLTPDDTRPPEHPAFVQVYYQSLYDRVLQPVLTHPNLSPEARFLVEQYMANLTDTTRDRPVARGDQDLCERIYRKHQRALDAIFMAVKEEIPSPRPTRTAQRFTVTLQDLVKAGLISPGQHLVGRNNQDTWEAELVEQDGSLLIRSVSDPTKASPNPSRTASDLVGRPMNGWAFWGIQSQALGKKTLADLREEFLRHTPGTTEPLGETEA